MEFVREDLGVGWIWGDGVHPITARAEDVDDANAGTRRCGESGPSVTGSNDGLDTHNISGGSQHAAALSRAEAER